MLHIQYDDTDLKRFVDIFRAVLVCLFGRELRFLVLHKLPPKNLWVRTRMDLNQICTNIITRFKLDLH